MKYQVSDDSGTTLVLEGDSPPSEQELEQVFSAVKPPAAEQPEKLTVPKFEGHMPTATAEDMNALTDPWYKPPKEYTESLVGLDPNKVPVGHTPITSLLSATAKTAVGAGAYLTSPQGATELALTKTVAAPAVLTKWAYDMLKGGYVSAKDAVDTVGVAIRDALSRKMISMNQLGPVPPDTTMDEHIQRIAEDVVNTAAMGLGGAAAAVHLPASVKGVVASIDSTIKPVAPATAEALKQTLTTEGGSQNAGQVKSSMGVSPNPPSRDIASLAEGAASQVQKPARAQAQNLRLRSTETGFAVFTEAGNKMTFDFPTIADAKIAMERLAQGRPVEKPAPALAPEAAAHLESAADSIDAPIELVPEASNEGDPFARQRQAGQFMGINRQRGTVEVYPEAFSQWLSKVPEERRPQAVRSRLAEEAIHLKVDDSAATTYWRTLTGFEQAIETRAYTGRWGEQAIQRYGLNDTLLGHEALRRRLQQLAGMEPSEIAEAALRERWTLKGLSVAETAVRGVREAMGTKASQDALAVLDRINVNIAGAKAIAGASPAALDKSQGDPKAITEDEIERLKVALGEAKASGDEQHAGELESQIEKLQQFVRVYGDQQSFPAALDKLVGEDRLVDRDKIGEGWLRPDGRIIKLDRTHEETATSLLPSDSKLSPLSDFEQLRRRGYARVSMGGYREFFVDPPISNTQARALRDLAIGGDYVVRDGMTSRVLFSRDTPAAIRRLTQAEWIKLDPKEQDKILAERQAEEKKLAGGAWQAQEAIAGRAKKQASELSQTKFFEDVTAKGKPAEEPAPQPGAVEAGASLVAGKDIEAAAQKHIESAITPKSRPDFREFSQWAQNNLGVKPEEIRTLWEDAVWKHLMQASPERLGEFRKALNLENKVGERSIATAPEAQPTFKLQGELEGGVRVDKLEQERERKQIVASQKYRANVVSAIARKLIGEAAPEKDFAKEQVGVDDLAYSNDRTVEGAYREINASEAKGTTNRQTGKAEPSEVLKKILVDQSRRSEADPVSATRRLTAIVNRKTGKVELVSTYKGPDEIMLVDPDFGIGKQRPNNRLSSLLNRYRPIASLLLEDPVQNFHQSFDSVSDFMEQIGKEASERARAVEYSAFTGEAPFHAEAESDAPLGTRPEDISEQAGERLGRTAVERGEGGGIVGPSADRARALLGMGRGELERGKGIPMTSREAGAVLDYLPDVKSPEDMRKALDDLAKLYEQGPGTAKTAVEVISKGGYFRGVEGATIRTPALRGIHRQVISAFAKAANVIARTHPDLTPDQAYRLALDHFYENIKESTDYEDYIQRTLGRFAQETGESGQAAQPAIPGAPAQAQGVSRELTMRSRVPPTTVRPEQVPPEARAIERKSPPERPEGRPGVLTPEKRLSAAEAESVRNRAIEEYPYTKTGYEPSAELAKRGIQIMPGAMGERPAAIDKLKEVGREKYAKTAALVGSLATRHSTKADVFRLRDGVDDAANQLTLQAGNSIRLASIKAPANTPASLIQRLIARSKASKEAQAVRGAARAVLASGNKTKDGVWYPRKGMLDVYLKKVETGAGRAEVLTRSKDARNAYVGRKWLAATEKLKQELEYAKEHWSDPELIATVKAAQGELHEQIEWEKANGSIVNEIENYLPGLYEGEFFNDNAVTFGEMRLLGRNYRLPKKFPTYYDAIKEGPYLPASYDVADIVQNRVSRGQHAVASRLWVDNVKGLVDPATKQKVGTEPIPVPVTEVDPLTGETREFNRWKSPAPNRELVYPTPGAKPVAVLKGYEGAVRTASLHSQVPESGLGKAALVASGALKHGVVLIADTFHPGRLGQYALALSGRKGGLIGYRGGYSALNYRLADLARAVEKGQISRGAADWAQGVVKVKTRSGQTLDFTRHAIAQEMIEQGLNAPKLADAMYREAVQRIPLIGPTWHAMLKPVNRWVFDHFTPGLMVETAVRNFERLNADHPDIPLHGLVKDIVKDVNAHFGNMGRQGFFKNPTYRDWAQVFILAPLWQEGLMQKELRFYARAARAPLRLIPGAEKLAGRQGLPAMGTLGRGIGNGLAGYFIATQAINLVTRGQFTFQNKEEGHKLDAWLPTGEGSGIWLSPMSVFAEKMHDLTRLAESKPTVWKALSQMGANILGPVGRFAHVLMTGQTPTGQEIGSTKGVITTAARQLAPAPISLATPGRALGHAIAPGTFAPNKPGELVQRGLGSVGVKTQLGESNLQQIQRKAFEFVRKNSLKPETGWTEQQTDAPSYTKMRSALWNNDLKGARQMLDELRKGRSDAQIEKGMKLWAKRPLTGGHANEDWFISSLNDDQLELYNRAINDKEALLDKFYQVMLQD